jgi:hypothetical protein
MTPKAIPGVPDGLAGTPFHATGWIPGRFMLPLSGIPSAPVAIPGVVPLGL